MGLILKYLGGAFGGYILIAAAALFATLAATLGVQTWRLHSLQTDYAKQTAAWATERNELTNMALKAEQDARKAEAQGRVELQLARDKYIQEQANAKALTDRTIAGLRDGTLKLRSRLAAVCGNSGATSGANSAGACTGSETGLRSEDAQVLIRLADEADGVVHLLNECRALLVADRKVCPAH